MLVGHKARHQEPTTTVGSVYNNYGNYLAVLMVDARHAHGWHGASDESDDDDYARGTSALRGNKLEVGGGQGVVCEIGGCGSAQVWQFANDGLLIVEHYDSDWDDEIEVDFIQRLTSTPTSKDVQRLGSFEVHGTLAIISLVEAVGEISESDIKEVIASKQSKSYEWGLLIPLPTGHYELWSESLEEVGDWGEISSRLRVVPKKTIVEAGAPIRQPQPRKSIEVGLALTEGQRFPADDWLGVKSFAVSADGSFVVAGEKGGDHVGAWDRNGDILWQTRLTRSTLSGAKYGYSVSVCLDEKGERLLADFDGLYAVDLRNQEVSKLSKCSRLSNDRLCAKL